jgi:hypothetical protein
MSRKPNPTAAVLNTRRPGSSTVHMFVVGCVSKTKELEQEIEPVPFCSEICFVGNQFGITSDMPAAVMTGGLVQEYKHVILPEVTPRTTFLCSLLSVVVSNNVIILWGNGTRLCVKVVLVISLRSEFSYIYCSISEEYSFGCKGAFRMHLRQI